MELTSKSYSIKSFSIVRILILYEVLLQVNANSIKASRDFNADIQPLRPPQCGMSNSHNKDLRIIGGHPSKLGAWPWLGNLGFIYDDDMNYYQFLCGGALISSRTILTAAHCFDDSSLDDIRVVRLGEYIFDDDTDGSNPIDYFIEEVIIHPNYIASGHENDVALIVLTDEVEFTDSIHPICLPVSDEWKDRDFNQDLPFIAGWGITGNYGGSSSKILLETEVPVVDTATCQKEYKFVANTTIDRRSICAGEDGISTCQGDSGGPLMLSIKDAYYAIGIVSNSFKCAEPGYPTVFMRVTSYLDFILENMI